MYRCKVLLQGEEMEFVGKNRSEAEMEMDFYMEELLEEKTPCKKNSFVKRKICEDLYLYRREVQAYQKLANSDICPKLLSHGVVFDYKVKDDPTVYYAYYIETELYGSSLEGRYNHNNNPHLDSRALDKRFDFSFYPNSVKEQIKRLVKKMHEAGVYHGDFHPGNLLIQDGKVKVIDFELVEFS